MREDERLNYSILNVFDFDDTLLRTPGPGCYKTAKMLRPSLDLKEEDIIYGKINWWDHPISLDAEIFDFIRIGPVFEKYQESLTNDKMCNAVITHRAVHMEEPIMILLRKYGFTNIHEFYANKLTVPKHVYLKLILYNYPKIDTINIYEDSVQNINGYYNYLKEIGTTFRSVNFYLINVVGVYNVKPPIIINSYVANKLLL